MNDKLSKDIKELRGQVDILQQAKKGVVDGLKEVVDLTKKNEGTLRVKLDNGRRIIAYEDSLGGTLFLFLTKGDERPLGYYNFADFAAEHWYIKHDESGNPQELTRVDCEAMRKDGVQGGYRPKYEEKTSVENPDELIGSFHKQEQLNKFIDAIKTRAVELV